jgi:hypothetical protein
MTSLRKRQHGIALPVVLMLSAMMLATSAAWFEMSIATARAASNTQNALQAFHAADAALTQCARMALDGTAPALPDVAQEPVGWQRAATFDTAALTPFAQWPDAWRPPRCLVEGWLPAARPDTHAWLITARGFGATQASQIWLQVELVVDGEQVERHWRQVVARPF